MVQQYFQDYMPGNVCFGCGTDNPKGLQIRSFWQDDVSTCLWKPQSQHAGWAGLTCGGILATIIDCHCIATSMATAIRNENRPLASEPHYLFATGSMNIKYLKPTTNELELRLNANVTNIKNERKYTIACAIYSGSEKTAEAEVITFLVYRSDKPDEAPEVFKRL